MKKRMVLFLLDMSELYNNCASTIAGDIARLATDACDLACMCGSSKAARVAGEVIDLAVMFGACAKLANEVVESAREEVEKL